MRMSRKEKGEEIKSKIKPKKCPRCRKLIVPEVGIRYKADSIHKLMEKLTELPFFDHIDVYYKCKCGYFGHQTYVNGKLISEIR